MQDDQDVGEPGEDSRWRGDDRRKMLDEVKEGLGRSPRELPSKYLYDRRGSRLFERITRLPEYYLTRSELQILEGPIRDRVRDVAPNGLVELGAGSARKTRILLEAMVGAVPDPIYVPVDVSAAFLDESARRLGDEHPDVRIRPEVADIESSFRIDVEMDPPVLFALLGSTIGNFPGRRGRELVARIREHMRPGDELLLGTDLRPGPSKGVGRLEAAYNDASGVTARFNRNILRVLNRELGTSFDAGAFRHRAFYDAERERIEMQLICERTQSVRLPDGTRFTLEAGEPIRTEVSCKYDRETVEDLLRGGGLEVEAWYVDRDGLYAMAVGRPGSSGDAAG